MGRSIPEPARSISDEVGDLLAAVTRRIRVTANRDLDPLGVNASQVRALARLLRLPEPVRMSDLADSLGIARRSATSVVDELEERGLVARSPDPADGRAVIVTVAPAGQALMGEVVRRRRAATARFTASLSAEDLMTLRHLLARLDETG